MARYGLYDPATYERNVTLATVNLSLAQTGPAGSVLQDTGQIVESVAGAGDAWTVTLKNTYKSIDVHIVCGTSTSPVPAAQNLIIELTGASGSTITFKLFDLDVAGGGAGAGYVYGDVAAYLSLRLAS